MKRALCLLLCGCSLRAPRVSESLPCSVTPQCQHANVCFLGECRPPAANLSVVAVEVRPADNSPYGAMQQGNIDLRASAVNDFALQAPLSASGSVAQDQAAGPVVVPGAAVTFTGHAPAIPDRVEQITAQTDPSGTFTARLPQGVWDVLITPPSQLPPFRPPALVTSAPALTYLLPNVTALVKVAGALTSQDGGPLPGASVTAVDATGAPLSAPDISEADGGYSLLLPPGTSTYLVQVGPPAQSDGGQAALSVDPLPVFDELTPGAQGLVAVTLTPEVTLTGHVTAAGAPVGAARVYARSHGEPWSLSRSAISADDGSYSMSLRAGIYVLEAAPSTDAAAPGVSGEEIAPVLITSAHDFSCPPKVQRHGLVVTQDGRAVGAGYQVTATRMADALLTTRTAITSPTDASGTYRLVADPGFYRFEVVPPPEAQLPRKIVQVDLGSDPADAALPAVQISPPLVAVGTVCGRPATSPCGSGDPAVAGATVSFFSLDASGAHGIFLGSALTDAKGHYAAVLPDVAQPGP